MTRRLFWIVVGAVAGGYVAVRVTRAAANVTPGGLADNLLGLGDAVRYFADQVREGMAEREIELRDALGLTDPEGRSGDPGGRGEDQRRMHP